MDVIDLGAGDNDTPPPAVAVEAMTRGARGSRATASTGSSRGCRRSGRRRRAGSSAASGCGSIPITETLPLIGSKEGLSHLPFAVVNPGDATIVPEPGYQAYLGGSILAGAEPYIAPLRPENDFLLDLEQVPRSGAAAGQAGVRQLSEQPDRRRRAPRVPRADGRALPAARHPARLRQRLLRSDLRRLPRAEHLRDPGRARRRARVLLALQELLDDRAGGSASRWDGRSWSAR